MAEYVTIRAPGRRPLRFARGGLHRSVGVPEGERIPEATMRAALRGEYGARAQKQARLATGALAAGRRTAARRRQARARARARR